MPLDAHVKPQNKTYPGEDTGEYILDALFGQVFQTQKRPTKCTVLHSLGNCSPIAIPFDIDTVSIICQSINHFCQNMLFSDFPLLELSFKDAGGGSLIKKEGGAVSGAGFMHGGKHSADWPPTSTKLGENSFLGQGELVLSHSYVLALVGPTNLNVATACLKRTWE